MQLQVNKYYKTRDGRKAFVGHHNPRRSDPWVGYVEYETLVYAWRDNGMFHPGNTLCANDLISEWQDAPAVGSSAWANSLPVGTKVRWHNWDKHEHAIRESNGWHLSHTNICPPGTYNHASGWLLYTEPELRPWNNVSEVPIDAIFRRKLSDNQHWYRCLGVATNLAFPVGHGLTWESFEVVFRTMDHSTDGGKTWRPCGVEE